MTTWCNVWVYSSGVSQQNVIDASRKVNREKDIAEFRKYPRSCRVEFEGTLKEGSQVTEYELLAWADGGNLCFGGRCEINGHNFKGSYNTD